MAIFKRKTKNTASKGETKPKKSTGRKRDGTFDFGNNFASGFGRPKKGKSMPDRARDLLSEFLDEETYPNYNKENFLMDLLFGMSTGQIKGDLPALKYLMEMAHGKLPEHILINDEKDQILNLENMSLDDKLRIEESLIKSDENQ